MAAQTDAQPSRDVRRASPERKKEETKGMIDPSVGILVSVIIMFVAYYLHEGRKITNLKSENTKLQKTTLELQKLIDDLQTESSEAKKIILDQQKQITILTHDVPPAAIGIPPEPDDYHAKRRRWIDRK